MRYDARTDHHHHFVCEDCGAVRDIEESKVKLDDAIRVTRATVAEFEVRDLSVLIRGLCSDCRAD